MAFPTIEFITEQPFVIKEHVPTDIQLSIATNTIGKNTLSLRLTAPSCSFEDDSQELSSEIETTALGEILELTKTIQLKSTVSRMLVIRLLAEITNTDGESDKSRLIVRLNCRPDVISDDTNSNDTNPI